MEFGSGSLDEAVTETKSLDHVKLAKYIHEHTFSTVAGDIGYTANRDWSHSRMIFTQFQNVRPNDLKQFSNTEHQVIVWPDKFKTGNIIYPYANAVKNNAGAVDCGAWSCPASRRNGAF
jgi:branched-chain amino acid transport system substrate-binding protein